MKTKLKIALVAHDQRKADMVDWVKFNAQYLSQHELVCTGTTGGLIKNAFSEAGIDAQVECMNSGPMGGDAEIAAMVVRNEIDLAVFLIDDLNAQPRGGHSDAFASMSSPQRADCLQPYKCRPDDFKPPVG